MLQGEGGCLLGRMDFKKSCNRQKVWNGVSTVCIGVVGEEKLMVDTPG